MNKKVAFFPTVGCRVVRRLGSPDGQESWESSLLERCKGGVLEDCGLLPPDSLEARRGGGEESGGKMRGARGVRGVRGVGKALIECPSSELRVVLEWFKEPAGRRKLKTVRLLSCDPNFRLELPGNFLFKGKLLSESAFRGLTWIIRGLQKMSPWAWWLVASEPEEEVGGECRITSAIEGLGVTWDMRVLRCWDNIWPMRMKQPRNMTNRIKRPICANQDEVLKEKCSVFN